MALDGAQLRAVEYPDDSPLAVTACAGAGKTTVLVERILRLLDRGYAARHILALTFSRKSADEMKGRLKIKGGRRTGDVRACTFHALALGYLTRFDKRYSEAGGKLQTVSQADKASLLIRIIEDNDYEAEVADALNFISWQKNSLRFPGEELDYSVCLGSQDEYAQIYADYEKALARFLAQSKKRRIDFDDMLPHFYLLLRENESVRREVADNHRYVLVDEFQDTCVAQHEVLKLLAAHGRLFVVGDSRQAIYSWRAARPDILLNFTENWERSSSITLDTNYRSTAPVVNLADAFIRESTTNYPGATKAYNKAGVPVDFALYADEEEEAIRTAEKILEEHAAGRAWDEMAILFRTNGQACFLEAALADKNIPFRSMVGNFFELQEVRATMAYLELLHDPGNEEAFRTVLKNPPRDIPLWFIKERTELARANGLPLPESFVTARATADALGLASMFSALALFKDKSPALAISAIQSMTECGSLGSVQSGPDTSGSAEMLLSLATKHNTIGDFLVYANKRKIASKAAAGVQLLTIHAAKGLEFPVVFLTGVADEIFPHRLSVVSPRTGVLSPLEEERRLCYVAVTRAKYKLSVSSIESYAGRLIRSRGFYEELRLAAEKASGNGDKNDCQE